MSGQRGFTLIEALIAFAILAVTLVAIYQAMGTSFRTLDRAAGVDEAVLVAQSVLDRIVAERRVPRLLSGEVGRYRWSAEVLPGAARGEKLTLRPMRLRVQWQGGGQGVAIERLLLVPVEQVVP
jgi:general secretion pathway protein I